MKLSEIIRTWYERHAEGPYNIELELWANKVKLLEEEIERFKKEPIYCVECLVRATQALETD